MIEDLTPEEAEQFRQEVADRIKRKDETYCFLVDSGKVCVVFRGKVVADTTIEELLRFNPLQGGMLNEQRRVEEQFATSPDRGMSLEDWQKWLVNGIIEKHNEGVSSYDIRQGFAKEWKRRIDGDVKDENEELPDAQS